MTSLLFIFFGCSCPLREDAAKTLLLGEHLQLLLERVKIVELTIH